jgi:hypothetical protein
MSKGRLVRRCYLLVCWPGGCGGTVLPSALATIVTLGLMAAAAPATLAEVPGEALINREYAIKAAYLFNFASYVTWPKGTFPDEQAPFLIGEIGDTPIDPYLDRIAARKKVNGRPIVVGHFDSPKDYQPCQILFVGGLSESQQRAVLQQVEKAPVLVVGETPGFAQHGGIVNFYIAENNVRFEINRDAAEKRNLKISSKLLALARIVPEDKGAAAHLEGGQIAWRAESQPGKQQAED